MVLLGSSKFPLSRCFTGCQEKGMVTMGTRIWNLTDRPVELQIRVDSILKKGHVLKPGSSKKLKCKCIYQMHSPRRAKKGENGLLYYHDETCHPYVWIQECGNHFSRMMRQQCISLEDLRDYSEIRIFRDHQKGCVSIRKKPRPEVC